MSKHLVAVYGSLRMGMHNHRLLSGQEFVGTDTVSGFTMVSLGGFPAVEDGEPSETIEIEVYAVNDTGLQNLNRLEGYYGDEEPERNFYQRVTVPTAYGPCFMYTMPNCRADHDAPVVVGGDWVQYRGAA